MGRETAQQLETALAVAPDASPRLAELTRAAAHSAAGELAAADALRDVAAGRVGGATAASSSSVEALTAAIGAAEGYPHLEARLPHLPPASLWGQILPLLRFLCGAITSNNVYGCSGRVLRGSEHCTGVLSAPRLCTPMNVSSAPDIWK